MRTKVVFSGLFAIVAVLAVIAGGWHLLNREHASVCPFSGRTIHAETRTLVKLAGKDYETCCVRCAIIEARQTGKSLRILKTADFYTGRLIASSDAWFVEGSAVNLCMSMSPAAESPERDSVYLRGFDRCSRSTLAFANPQQAREFIAHNGGTLKRVEDLLREVPAERTTAQ